MVAGGSGLIGTLLLRVLLANPAYARVIALSRRPLPLEHAKFANRILRFESLEAELGNLTCQDAFCCLGTTMHQAGSEAAFRAVDHDLILRFARAARAAGAQQLIAVSSVAADAASRHLYLRVKGETESALEAQRFAGLHLMQPGLLLGRQRQRRVNETLAGAAMLLINPLLQGSWRRWRAIDAGTVARAMCAAALSGRRGVFRHTNEAMMRLAQGPVPIRV